MHVVSIQIGMHHSYDLCFWTSRKMELLEIGLIEMVFSFHLFHSFVDKQNLV